MNRSKFLPVLALVGAAIAVGLQAAGAVRTGSAPSENRTPQRGTAKADGKSFTARHPALEFEELWLGGDTTRPQMQVHRARVPGGWLVRYEQYFLPKGVSITFYPDPDHKWKDTGWPEAEKDSARKPKSPE